MWHTITCFLGGHDYRRVAERDGHHEYVCVDCGHPLLFADDHGDRFEKRVCYACNLFGHEVSRIATRGGLTEYACRCGHTFLKREPDLVRVTHPPICTLRGHVIRFVERRGDLDEYTCERCGHTFCFAARVAGHAPVANQHASRSAAGFPRGE